MSRDKSSPITVGPRVDGRLLKRRSQSSIEDQFWSRVEEAPTGCWLWTGPLGAAGYAVWHYGIPHRWAYEFVVGRIPAGLHIDHLCRVRHCVNPAHMEPVRPTENSRRRPRARWHPLALAVEAEAA